MRLPLTRRRGLTSSADVVREDVLYGHALLRDVREACLAIAHLSMLELLTVV